MLELVVSLNKHPCAGVFCTLHVLCGWVSLVSYFELLTEGSDRSLNLSNLCEFAVLLRQQLPPPPLPVWQQLWQRLLALNARTLFSHGGALKLSS